MFAHNANMSRRLQKVFTLKHWKVQRRTEATAMYSACIDASLQNVPAERITAVFDSIHANVCDYAHRHAFVVDIERFNWQDWEPLEQEDEQEQELEPIPHLEHLRIWMRNLPDNLRIARRAYAVRAMHKWSDNIVPEWLERMYIKHELRLTLIDD